MTALTIIGLILQLAGTAIAGYALYEDYRDHANGRPMVPAIARAWGQIRRRFGFTTIHRTGRLELPLNTAVLLGTGVGYADITPGPRDTLEQQVMMLRGRVERLTTEIRGVESSIVAARAEAKGDVAEVREHADAVRTELTDKLNAFATGRVTAELFGLVLVGLGTIAGSVGSLL